MIRRGAELLPTGECADVAVPDDHIVGVSALDAAVAAIKAQCAASPSPIRVPLVRTLVRYSCGHEITEQRAGGARLRAVWSLCPYCASGGTRPAAGRIEREEQRLSVGTAEHLAAARTAMEGR